MKILTLVGTRPELIRLSVIIEKLDKLVDIVEHVLVYTNQNYDYNLSTIFFNDLKIRQPNYYFKRESTSFGDFFGNAIIEFEEILINEKPDKLLILGDTNTGLLSIIAEKYKIPVYHMEAGNRSYDNRLPEETNRKIIDSLSKYNLPYTDNSKENLIREGYHKNFVFKTGNPIYEVLKKFDYNISNSQIVKKLSVSVFVLVTIHRSENVDNEDSLVSIINAINVISENTPMVLSLHPRTKSKLQKFNVTLNKNIIVLEPLGFFDFVKLEKSARCVISDSGTVQEECCIFGVPSITIRQSTERQETIECGSNVLSGTKTEDIVNAYKTIKCNKCEWITPSDYLVPNVSDVVINILLGK